MLKKRIIFTLLYCDGFFVQSRNFDTQRVGDLNWLIKQYNQCKKDKIKKDYPQSTDPK